MECMRKEGGESKNGTSMMSVIIEAGALSMLSTFKHPRSIDITSTSPDPKQSLLEHVLGSMKTIRHDEPNAEITEPNAEITEPNAEMDRERFKQFLEKLDELYIDEPDDDQPDDNQPVDNQPASKTTYSDFVKKLINLREEGSQDLRRFDTFMVSLTFIEEMWRSWLISSRDIEIDFQYDEDYEVDSENDEDIEGKREIAEATYEYMEEFSNLHTAFLEDYSKGIYDSYLNNNNNTKRVLEYWINKRNRNLGRNQGVI